MSSETQDHQYAVACENERRTANYHAYELREMHAVPALAKKTRLAFEQAKVEGFSGPAGDAFFQADRELQDAFENERNVEQGETNRQVAQIAG